MKILPLWEKLQGLPFGKCLFSWLVGRKAPYTGSIRAQVLEVRSGFCRVEMKDRPKLRNHLQSIHAVALTNLGEMTSGVALLSSMPEGWRGIPIHFSIRFLKKARGKLTATCQSPLPASDLKSEYDVIANIENEARERVAEFKATWRIGPVSKGN